jgi:hypothetical protein
VGCVCVEGGRKVQCSHLANPVAQTLKEAGEGGKDAMTVEECGEAILDAADRRLRKVCSRREFDFFRKPACTYFLFSFFFFFSVGVFSV